MSVNVFDWFALVGDGETKPQNALTVGRGDCTYVRFGEQAIKSGAKNLYVSSLDMPDKDLDALIDYALGGDVKLAVSTGSTLTEMGIIDSRFGKSPIMLLHEFGLMGCSTVISGVYLDKDDLSLMAQEQVPLTVLPTFDSGCGNGVAPVAAAFERGVELRIGSATGEFNRSRNIIYEAAFLRLCTSAFLNRRNPVPLHYLARACLPQGATDARIGELEKAILEF